MKNLVIQFLLNLVSADLIGKVIAFCISKLLKYASKRGGNSWQTAKNTMKSIENWTHLFNEVYEDDQMTSDEETLVANAIANMTAVNKVSKIISEKKSYT